MTDKRKPAPKLDEIRPPTLADFRKDAAEVFESRMVEFLLVYYKIPTELRRQVRECFVADTGEGYTFAAFHEVFPAYPVFFQTRVAAHLAKDCSLLSLFMDFNSRKIVEVYRQASEHVPPYAEGRSRAVIFRWPRMSRTGLVLHDRAPKFETPGVRMVWQSTEDDTRLSLEPLPIFLQTLSVDCSRETWDNGYDF